MEARAIANTIRITPRKARLVVDLIRNKDVAEAKHNYNMDSSNLYVKTAYVNDGVRMKRMLPRAKGRGDVIQKRTCHITVIVAEKESK